MKITVKQLRKIIREEVEQERVRRVVRSSIDESFFDTISRKASQFVGRAQPKAKEAALRIANSMLPHPLFGDVKLEVVDLVAGSGQTLVVQEKESETARIQKLMREDMPGHDDEAEDPFATKTAEWKKRTKLIRMWNEKVENAINNDPQLEGYEVVVKVPNDER